MSENATLEPPQAGRGGAPHADRPDAEQPNAKQPQGSESWGSFLAFVLKLVLAVVLFRTLVFAPFTIPSESMLPLLRNGDYLVAAKWPYGYSRLSLPFQAPLFPGRVFADLPERGEVVIFKHPIDQTDYIKRVIGLPGDRVELRGG
ncbi:MAG: signal peptidase I, partial [Erythrobacter sp.]|nr:signal peptidase I [Erythrobacter sp.]